MSRFLDDIALTNEEALPLSPVEWAAIESRLEGAGYSGDFEILGAGMTAIVLLGPDGSAYKVARPNTFEDRNARMLADEYDFLKTLGKTDAAPHLPHAYAFDRKAGVLVRDAVAGDPGRWGTRGLREVFEKIQLAARANLWSAPEFKEDSFVVGSDGVPVMVDVGFASRLGHRLADHVEDLIADGFDFTEREARDFAWALRMDAMDGLVSAERVAAVQRKLEAIVGKDLA